MFLTEEPISYLTLWAAYSQFSSNLRRGLDKGIPALRIGIIFTTMQMCEHARTEILARRDGVDYVRCLDCDQVFEAEDLESVPVYDEDDQPAA